MRRGRGVCCFSRLCFFFAGKWSKSCKIWAPAKLAGALLEPVFGPSRSKIDFVLRASASLVAVSRRFPISCMPFGPTERLRGARGAVVENLGRPAFDHRLAASKMGVPSLSGSGLGPWSRGVGRPVFANFMPRMQPGRPPARCAVSVWTNECAGGAALVFLFAFDFFLQGSGQKVAKCGPRLI